MNSTISLISTDFDGTLHSDLEHPPVPDRLQSLIASVQEQGVKWVINTGRDLSSVLEAMARAHLAIKPDYIVVVEREIFFHQQSQYVGMEDWNRTCTAAHAELFQRVRGDMPQLIQWVNDRFQATVYEDAYSPFCLLAESNEDADAIHAYLEEYCRKVSDLSVVRNDVYARFAHAAFNKGTALHEIARLLGVHTDAVVAAGDHLNDLPMLSREFARWLIAPGNAVEAVKSAVRRQGGHVSTLLHGHAICEGLEMLLPRCAAQTG